MVELHNIDCLEYMKSLPDKMFDAVITDPPYGIKRDKGFGGFGGFGKPIARKQYQGEWDNVRPTAEHFSEILRVSKIAVIFGGNFFADILPVGNHWIVWDKLNTMPTFGDVELAWTNVKRNSVKKFTCQYNGLLGKEEKRFHATQKPLKLMKWCVEQYTKPGETVFDPYAGSGTTGVACVELDREFSGCEIDGVYYPKATRRINEASLQCQMFPAASSANKHLQPDQNRAEQISFFWRLK